MGEARAGIKVRFFRDNHLLAKLQPEECHLLLALVTYADKYGTCFPSRDTLARTLNISPSAVSARLERLEQVRILGLPIIEVDRGSKANGKRRSNRYRIFPTAGFAFVYEDGSMSGSPNVVESTASCHERMGSRHGSTRQISRSIKSSSNISTYRAAPSSVQDVKAFARMLAERAATREKGAEDYGS